MPSLKDVEMVYLTEKHEFHFRCHTAISCFTKCCSNIEILLTPYDILRLKNALGITSGEFLNDYTYVQIDEKTSHPFVFLKLNSDKERTCPFVTPQGCKVYPHRPANCRYYPVGQASLKKMDEEKKMPVNEEFYFFVREKHCLGFAEDTKWSIKSWRQDQGVDLYDDLNRGWKEILFRRNLPGHTLDENKQKAFYMACYDIDRFRRFVFESGFLQKFDIDEQTANKIKEHETELMKFGFDYTKFILMMQETLKLRQ